MVGKTNTEYFLGDGCIPGLKGRVNSTLPTVFMAKIITTIRNVLDDVTRTIQGIITDQAEKMFRAHVPRLIEPSLVRQ